MRILWKWRTGAGHDLCDWSPRSLRGTALISHQGKPWAVSYGVEWDREGRTRGAKVETRMDGRLRTFLVEADRRGRWTLNGRRVAGVDGCVDIDLNFSPSTNTLPIRRLRLGQGKSAEIRAAWLRFPSFTLEPLDQVYRRVGAGTYRYASGNFRATLDVNRAGIVTRYGRVWIAVGQED